MSLHRRTFLAASAAIVSTGLLPMRLQAKEKPVVFLAGATGRNGSAVLRALISLPDAPFTVVAMSRNAAQAREKFPQARWVEGDVTQPESLTRAMSGGVDFIVSAVATAQGEGPNRPEMVDAQGTRNLIAAGKKAGAKRFVIITSSVSGMVDHPLNKRVGNVLVYKAEAEKALYESGLEYVVVGPAGMTDEPAGRRKIVLMPRDQYRQGMTIGRDDTARVIVEALTNPQAANRTFTVAYGDGPDDADWKAALGALPRK